MPWHESKVIAPTLLDLAKSGVILEQHYVQPICTPTRGALMTGKYAARLGLQHSIIGPVSDPIKFGVSSIFNLTKILKSHNLVMDDKKIFYMLP